MSIIIFIIILGVLIFVHELGHFLVAKKSGIRVDEFAVGFPPKIFSFVKGGTRYALNLIPFGGYVKIFGENPDEESLNPERTDSFVNKSKTTQISVLVAGVLFNALFAWFLLSISFMSGSPAIVTEQNIGSIDEANVVVTNVLFDSPADQIGLEVGDKVLSLETSNQLLEGQFNVFDVQRFIKQSDNQTITLNIQRNGEKLALDATPAEGIVEGKRAIGISMELIGTQKYSFFEAIWNGFVTTGGMIKNVSIGLYAFLFDAITFNADLSSVAGPVGIVSLVDNASNFGFTYLLTFTAFISLNLAVLNLLPFPALDGGRILFVIIESIMGKPIKPSIANTLNLLGFAFLILLMLVITISDVSKLF